VTAREKSSVSGPPAVDSDGGLDGEGDLARCRVCGCTEDAACPGGCCWVLDPWQHRDLCSACLPPDPAELAAGLRVEHGVQMSGGGWHLRPEEAAVPGLEGIYPLERYVANGKRRGSVVGRRTVVVVEDWHEV
jgi:hypothetical protein